MARSSRYTSPLPVFAACARCDFTGTREDWHTHRCPASIGTVEQEDGSAFAEFWRALQPDSRGRISQRVVRQAAVAVGWREPAREMPDVVKAELRERNQRRAGHGNE